MPFLSVAKLRPSVPADSCSSRSEWNHATDRRRRRPATSPNAAAVRRAASAHGHEVELREVRTSGHVPDADLLLMPGEESTTISRHLRREGIAEEIREYIAADKPVLATCAGLIVATRDAKDDRVDELGLLGVTVDRNAFGRQADSFEPPLDVTGLDSPFPGCSSARPSSTRWARGSRCWPPGNRPVAVRDGRVIGTTFHPQLTDDPRIHDLALFETGATLPGR